MVLQSALQRSLIALSCNQFISDCMIPSLFLEKTGNYFLTQLSQRRAKTLGEGQHSSSRHTAKMSICTPVFIANTCFPHTVKWQDKCATPRSPTSLIMLCMLKGILNQADCWRPMDQWTAWTNPTGVQEGELAWGGGCAAHPQGHGLWHADKSLRKKTEVLWPHREGVWLNHFWSMV